MYTAHIVYYTKHADRDKVKTLFSVIYKRLILLQILKQSAAAFTLMYLIFES